MLASLACFSANALASAACFYASAFAAAAAFFSAAALAYAACRSASALASAYFFAASALASAYCLSANALLSAACRSASRLCYYSAAAASASAFAFISAAFNLYCSTCCCCCCWCCCNLSFYYCCYWDYDYYCYYYYYCYNYCDYFAADGNDFPPSSASMVLKRESIISNVVVSRASIMSCSPHLKWACQACVNGNPHLPTSLRKNRSTVCMSCYVVSYGIRSSSIIRLSSPKASTLDMKCSKLTNNTINWPERWALLTTDFSESKNASWKQVQ